MPVSENYQRDPELKCIRPIHPFPARMAAAMALQLIPGVGPQQRILDPMAGSGTTPVLARLLGHHAVAFDTDPLAITISRAWCSTFDPEKLRTLAETALRQAMRRTSNSNAYPSVTDDETRKFMRYWFDGFNRRQLTRLATAIHQCGEQNYRNLLWCAFSRLIITKTVGASLAIDVSHSRPHRAYDRAPIKPFESFLTSVDRIIKLSPFKHEGSSIPKALIKRADARKLPVPDCSVDLVITSPPYSDAIDYLRAHKLSLVWMGFNLDQIRNLRGRSLGGRSGHLNQWEENRLKSVIHSMGRVERLPENKHRMLAHYVGGLDLVIREIARVLRPAGRSVLVVGDAMVRDVFVRNSEAINLLAEHHGLKTIDWKCRPLPDNHRYLPPPLTTKSHLRHRMRNEVVLTFSKTSRSG